MNDRTRKRDRLFICSFCGKNSHQVDCIVTGPDVYICNECVRSAGQIIKDDMKRRKLDTLQHIRTPMEIKKELDRFVIGQDEAKKIISVAVYNHFKRIENIDQTVRSQTAGGDIGFCSADIHPAIHHRRVDADDIAGEIFCEGYCQVGFTGSCRSHQTDDP